MSLDTGRFAWLVLPLLVVAPGCEEKKGIEALPASIRPVEGTEVHFYTVNSTRCRYWVEPFETRDGKGGGRQCVSAESLRALCLVADCHAEAGSPPGSPRGR